MPLMWVRTSPSAGYRGGTYQAPAHLVGTMAQEGLSLGATGTSTHGSPQVAGASGRCGSLQGGGLSWPPVAFHWWTHCLTETALSAGR